MSDDYDSIWAAGWDDMRRYGPMARHSRRLMRRLTADLPVKSILDVGCGEGSMLRALSADHPGAALAGIEISETAANMARRALPQTDVAVMDVAASRLERTFDLVISADVIEHIADDRAALANMAAMTAPAGWLVVATLQGRMREFERAIGHQRNYVRGELAEKMRDAGLTVDGTIEWGFPLYSPIYRNLIQAVDNRGTIGRFGLGRRLLCHAIYTAFLLNSSRRGDYVFVRGRKPAVN